MKYAVSDGADRRERQNEDQKGIEESEPKGIVVNGRRRRRLLGLEMKSVPEENMSVDRERIGDEAMEGRVNDEGEGNWEEEDDGESKEVTRVRVDDAFRFGEDGPEIEGRTMLRHRHGRLR